MLESLAAQIWAGTCPGFGMGAHLFCKVDSRFAAWLVIDSNDCCFFDVKWIGSGGKAAAAALPC